MNGSTRNDATLFVHVPDVRLEHGLEIAHAGGCVRRLDYAEWLALDSEYAGKRQVAFERAEPCFYVRPETISRPDFSTVMAALDGRSLGAALELEAERWIAVVEPAVADGRRAADEVRLAIALRTGAPTRSIADSITYLAGGGTTFRDAGRIAQRAILDVDPGPTIRSADVHAVAETLRLIVEARGATRLGEFKHAAATLGATALPDFEPIDGLMHTAMSLEAILSADVTSGVTAAFIQRGAALLANEPAEIDRLRSLLDRVYSMRSDALHGRIAAFAPAAGPDASFLWDWTRKALGRALLRLLHVCRGEADCGSRLVQLRDELEAARAGRTIPSMLAGAPAGAPL